MTQFAYLGIGSNLGDRLDMCCRAVFQLNRLPSSKVTRVSSVYETKAVGIKDQPDFLNCAVELQTALEPFELLKNCQTIENFLGRKQTRRWGPRTIDIDILTINSIRINTTRLTVPHRELANRRFVLIPLQELSAERVIPIHEKTVSQLMQETADQSRVKLVLAKDKFLKMVKEVGT